MKIPLNALFLSSVGFFMLSECGWVVIVYPSGQSVMKPHAKGETFPKRLWAFIVHNGFHDQWVKRCGIYSTIELRSNVHEALHIVTRDNYPQKWNRVW
jgi:hypothetical protein